MALTNAQRVSIRFYLGYQGRYFQIDNPLEQAMNAIDDADLVTRINTVIVDLDTVDALRSSVRSRGGIASADEVQFQPGTHASLSALMSEGTMLVGRLAAMLGVDVRHNPFSTAAPSSGYMKQG